MQPTVAVQIKKHSHKSQHIFMKAVSAYFTIHGHGFSMGMLKPYPTTMKSFTKARSTTLIPTDHICLMLTMFQME